VTKKVSTINLIFGILSLQVINQLNGNQIVTYTCKECFDEMLQKMKYDNTLEEIFIAHLILPI
jgi:hypothetical protein